MKTHSLTAPHPPYAADHTTRSLQEGQAAPPPATVYPHTSLAEVLGEVFDQVLAVERADKASPEKAQGRLLLFPECAALREGKAMQRFGDHLDLCKEVCEVLGVSQNAVSLHPAISGSYHCPVPAIYVKPIPQGSLDFPDVRTLFIFLGCVWWCLAALP